MNIIKIVYYKKTSISTTKLSALHDISSFLDAMYSSGWKWMMQNDFQQCFDFRIASVDTEESETLRESVVHMCGGQCYIDDCFHSSYFSTQQDGRRIPLS